MRYLLLLIGSIALLQSKKTSGSNTGGIYDPIPGGKNLVSNDFPLNEYGLPISIHIYKSDFPLFANDRGSVISVLQQMINVRDFTIPITGVLDQATLNAWGSGNVTLDDFYAYATQDPPIVPGVEIYQFKPNTY